MSAPDTVEGRFELLSLHVILLVDRLSEFGQDLQDLRQALFDTYVGDLDGAMREMGVADLSMGKRMRKLGEAFYGRLAAYEDAFQSLPDTSDLEALISRTVFEGLECSPKPLANYIVGARAALKSSSEQSFLLGSPAWSAA